MMAVRPLILFFLLSISSTIFAQEITFVISDSSGVAVPFVLVEIDAPNNETSFSFFSDSSGVVSLSGIKPGDYYMALSHQAFLHKTLSINIPNNIPDTVVLNDDLNFIDESIIIGDRVQYYSNRIVVSGLDDRVSKGRAVSEALEFLPGLSRDNSGLIIFGRGCSLIYLNGRPLKNTAELDLISADDIARIEIVPLAGSKYSSTMESGILKIWLKAETRNTLSLDFSSSSKLGRDIFSESNSLAFGYKHNRLNVYNYSNVLWSRLNDYYDRTSLYPLIDRRIESTYRSEQITKSLSDAFSLVYDLKHDDNIGFYISYFPKKTLTDISNSSRLHFSNGSMASSSYGGKNERIDGELQTNMSYLKTTDSIGSTVSASIDFILSSPYSDMPYRIIEDHDNQQIEQYIDHSDENMKQLLFSVDRERNINKTNSISYGICSSYIVSSSNYSYTHLPLDNIHYDYSFNLSNYSAYSEYECSLGRSSFNIGLRAETNSLHSSIYRENASKQYYRLFPTLGYAFSIDKAKGMYFNINYSRKGGDIPYEYLSPVIVKHNEYSYSKGNIDLDPNDIHSVVAIFQVNRHLGITYSLSNRSKKIEQNTYLDSFDSMVKYTIPENTGNSLFQQFYIEENNLQLAKFWTLNLDIYGERAILTSLNNGKRDKLSGGFYFSSVFDLGKDYLFTLNSSGETGKYWSFQQYYKGVWYSRASIQKYFNNRNLSVSLTLLGLFYRTREIEITTSEYSNSSKYNTDQKAALLTIRWNFKTGKGEKVKKISTNQSRKYASYQD